MKTFRKTIIFLLVWFFFASFDFAQSLPRACRGDKVGIAIAADNFNDRMSNNPFAIPTFHCISVYWSPPGGAADKDVLVNYRATGTPVVSKVEPSEWAKALPMRYNPIDRTTEDKADYRGSIVNLTPDTEYEIYLTLEGTSQTSTLSARTWSEDFPIGAKVSVGNQRSQYAITVSGTADAYSWF